MLVGLIKIREEITWKYNDALFMAAEFKDKFSRRG